MLQSRRRETAAQKAHPSTAPPSVLFVILLVVALVGLAHGLWHGHWVIVALNAVTAAMAIWGLRRPRQQATGSDPSRATVQSTGSADGARPDPSPQATNSPTRPQPSPQTAVVLGNTTIAPDPAGLPVVDSFAITGWLRWPAGDATARLSLALPADTEVTTGPVIAALLTTGQRILEDHHLTHQPLPPVEVTTVERTQQPPATTSGTGFTVHITNDLTTRRSDITVETDQLPGTEGGALLIAATILAGAEHLLENPDRSLPHRTGPAHRRGDPRRGRASSSTPR